MTAGVDLAPATERPDPGPRIELLWKRRYRNRFVRWSLGSFAALIAASWAFGDFDFGALFTARRWENFQRFAGEVRPFPLQGEAWDWGTAFSWAGDLLADVGIEAALATLAISVLAIVLAGAGGVLASLTAARTYATPEPYLPSGRPPTTLLRWAWRATVVVTRALLILMRAIPEYVWAFLLLAMLGPNAWPAVLALAIHNMGILGRLNAEILENLEPAIPRALRSAGASRTQIVATTTIPMTMPRFLLYFFYRWETAVREATVLGMLGIVSLGFWIADARVRIQYDRMLFLILLGSAIIVIGDFVSAAVRGLVRRAS